MDHLPNNNEFATTRWTLVLGAAKEKSTQPAARDRSRDALEELCRIYWFPLYSFARRQGETPESALDATQSFFVDLLESSWINRADPTLGRFRGYLVTVFRRFLNDQRKRELAKKRGGDRQVVSIDGAAAEQRYRLEPAEMATAEDLYERRWALALLDRVYCRLSEEYAAKGKGELFITIQQYLLAADRTPYSEVAERTGMTVSNVKVAVHRLRQRYGKILEDEVAQTVASPADIESELNALLAALSREK